MTDDHDGIAPDAGLTGREREALRLLADGRPLAEVATAMHISPDTVLNHLRSVIAKLAAP